MKKAILIVNFGTSHTDARERSLDGIFADIKEAAEGVPVYQCYTSEMILRNLAKEGIQIPTVEEAVEQILEKGADCLYVVPTHMIPGEEYHKMSGILERYRAKFIGLKVASAVLETRTACDALVPILCHILDFKEEHEYILMGHGTEADANVRYDEMNDALWKAGYCNVQIASVEAKPDIEDAVIRLKERGCHRKIILHPFMVVAGDHAKNDMAGEENSYITRLEAEGYEVEAVVKGLGEYPHFRKIYVDKLREIM